MSRPLQKCIILSVLTAAIFTECKSPYKYDIYKFDNGDDYFCEGYQRIVDKDGKVGFRDSLGNVIIEPRFAFAYPFKGGYAEVTDSGYNESVKPGNEYHEWISDSWYLIDRKGNAVSNLTEIKGFILFADDGKPLEGAIIKNCRNGKSVASKDDGSFHILALNGDTLDLSYVGTVRQRIPVNPSDSTNWTVSLCPMGPIVEPMLQHSVSSLDGVTMSVEGLNDLKIPVDSIVVSICNSTDHILLFGEKYRLEKQDGETWIPMPYNRKYEDGECIQVFTAIGYIYTPHSTHSNVNHTQPFSKKFNRGIYRLTKNFRVETAAGWNREDSISVEFEIE